MKPIIATTLSGLFIRTTPWKEAHKLWFKQAAEELNDPSILDWAKKENYFPGVDLVMKRRFPDLPEEERTKKARGLFFDAVCAYMETHPEIRNTDVINYFQTLKGRYQLALITSNTENAIGKILTINNLQNFFGIIETSKAEEKDKKTLVFKRFIERHGKPFLYVGGEKKETYEFCKEQNIFTIFANLEGNEDISGVRAVHSLEELQSAIASNP